MKFGNVNSTAELNGDLGCVTGFYSQRCHWEVRASRPGCIAILCNNLKYLAACPVCKDDEILVPSAIFDSSGYGWNDESMGKSPVDFLLKADSVENESPL